MAASGSWSQVRKLRQKPKLNQGRLHDSAGNLVSSEERAQTFAEYLQDIQWAVRSALLTDEAPLYDELPVQAGPISLKELKLATESLREEKASGPDGHPLEFWKAVLESDGPRLDEGAAWLLELCIQQTVAIIVRFVCSKLLTKYLPWSS